MLNRGNELKDLLKTQDLASFGAKNELKTNSLLSAKSAKSREQDTGNREEGTGSREQGTVDREQGKEALFGDASRVAHVREAEPAVPQAGALGGDKMSLGASKK